MEIRNRVKQLRLVRLKDLRPNPRNWRTHPPCQRRALEAVLAEVGFADALIARELPDGSLELIDGHLRAELLPDDRLPVLVLDVDQQEADKLLASLDPLAALAGRNQDAVAALIARVQSESEHLQALFRGLREGTNLAEPAPRVGESAADEPKPVKIGESFQLVIECHDESQQRELYERLTKEGYRCRVLTL